MSIWVETLTRQALEVEVLSRPKRQLRFWEQVEKTDRCWNWTGYKAWDGYGKFCMRRKKSYQSHRIAWIITHNKAIPTGMFICHHCDNRACVNPSHLYLGTAADNNRDRDERKRFVALRGNSNGNSKLTPEQIIRIRTLREQGERTQSLASEFHITPQMVGLVVRRQRWAHL